MDGLPLTEETGLPFGSAHPGVMHACGHDVHMTCGLGLLERILDRPQRHSFVFLFQPAEENISGAQAICDAGILDKYRISEFYALHVSPEWDAGVAEGVALATGASVDVRLEDGPWVPVRNDRTISARFTDYMRSGPTWPSKTHRSPWRRRTTVT